MCNAVRQEIRATSGEACHRTLTSLLASLPAALSSSRVADITPATIPNTQAVLSSAIIASALAGLSL